MAVVRVAQAAFFRFFSSSFGEDLAYMTRSASSIEVQFSPLPGSPKKEFAAWCLALPM